MGGILIDAGNPKPKSRPIQIEISHIQIQTNERISELAACLHTNQQQPADRSKGNDKVRVSVGIDDSSI